MDMVKLSVMEQREELVTEGPPRLIPSLGAGFNAIANNVTLIILPILVDLILWLGPRLRVRDLFLLEESGNRISTTDFSMVVNPARLLWKMVRTSSDLSRKSSSRFSWRELLLSIAGSKWSGNKLRYR